MAACPYTAHACHRVKTCADGQGQVCGHDGTSTVGGDGICACSGTTGTGGELGAGRAGARFMAARSLATVTRSSETIPGVEVGAAIMEHSALNSGSSDARRKAVATADPMQRWAPTPKAS